MRSNGNLMLGISIIFFGVVFFLEATGILFGIGGFGEFWPALLIVLGVVSWLSHGRKPSIANVMVILLGVAFLGGTLFRWDASKYLWPGLLILIGINLAIGPKVRGKFLR